MAEIVPEWRGFSEAYALGNRDAVPAASGPVSDTREGFAGVWHLDKDGHTNDGG